MVAEFVEGLMRHGKRGAAYVGVGVLQSLLGFYCALHAPLALTGLATVFGVINLNLYGGGALAKWAETRNGNGGVTNIVTPPHP